MTLRVVGNTKQAHLDDKGEPVVAFAISLRAAHMSLDFITSDAELAKRFSFNATLDVDLEAVKAVPPPPEAEPAPAAAAE